MCGTAEVATANSVGSRGQRAIEEGEKAIPNDGLHSQINPFPLRPET